MNNEPLLENGTLIPATLDAPAPAGVAALGLDRVHAVRAVRPRLDDVNDPEALHDFRVAIRRLRSLLRAFRPATRGAIPRRQRQSLRRIARSTNASRDFQVKLAWLRAAEADLRPRDKVGLRWLIRRLEVDRRKADARALARIEKGLDWTLGGLEERLGDLAAASTSTAPALGLVVATRLADLVDRLRDRLRRVTSITHQEAAHEARIAGKRVRYLLEPLVLARPAAFVLVDRLKLLQDVLGEMHDADVLAGAVASAMERAATERGHRVAALVREGENLDRSALRRERRRDPMPGLVALAARVRDRRAAAWAEVEREWLGRAEELLLVPAERLAAELEATAPTPAPGLEIERKFLLRELPPRAGDAPAMDIEQGYVPGDRIQERVRRVRSGETTQWYRTLKDGIGLVRSEIEEPTSAAVFDALWSLTEGRRVLKRRHTVEANGLVWEIDQFTDRELVLAEVELADAGQTVEPPDWLAPYVVREVTEEAEYLNVNLAK